jgi:hypothetical protein
MSTTLESRLYATRLKEPVGLRFKNGFNVPGAASAQEAKAKTDGIILNFMMWNEIVPFELKVLSCLIDPFVDILYTLSSG